MLTTLKDAVRRVIENSPVSTRALAEELGISYSYLMNAANPELADFKLPARLLIPLTRITGDYSAINFLEHALHRTAIALPKSDPNLKARDIQPELLNTINSFGTLISDSSAALEDNYISAREAAAIERDSFKLISKILQLLDAIETCRTQRRGYVD